ncbi:hypothetical protein AB1Y20_010345 [Prymnesium parvum]|uniref:RRM domain-containing protein n=1 Tax=Prymnesium parvum TaxID=97485 RepID=A0AB34K4K6_PRYPA
MNYAAAMAAEHARLEKARKRSMEAASLHGKEEEHVESAWEAVFQMGQQGDDEQEEARRRKAMRKAEKRKEKQSSAFANAGELTVYVSGIPRDIGWTAVQNLFARAGEVRRVKLYKDANGEHKGDGLVTFAKEAAVQAALARDDWQLFGEPLTVSPASFSEKPEGTPRSDWPRVVVLEQMFSVEEIGAAPDARAYISQLEEEAWLECVKFGRVECVRCFPADPQAVIVVRFADAAAADKCIASLHGRWFAERRVVASPYDGHKKRILPPEADEERISRLVAPPPAAAPPPDPSPPPAAPPPEEELSLPLGGYVKLLGLRAAELNGAVGVLRAWDGASGRYTVELRDGARLAVRRGNLLQLLDVRLEAGEAAAARGTIVEFDEASGMYAVELADGAAVAAAAGDVRLADGAVGTVQGLSGAPQYNGCLARVEAHDDAAGRYVVRLAEGKQLKIKRANLRA